MEGIEKDNSILFSASVTPFDDILPAVIAPPIEDLGQASGTSEKNNGQEYVRSLQPHLESNKSESLSSSHLTSGSDYVSTDLSRKSGVTPPPPPTAILSDFSLRRPSNKYVVPPEITNSTAYNSKPASPPLPNPPVSPNSTPFSPSQNYGSFVPDSNSSLDTSETVSVAAASDNFLTESFSSPNQTSEASVIPASFTTMASNPPDQRNVYHPVIHHWFYAEGKPLIWKPFSFVDSINLEEEFRTESTGVVSTNGGRYDVFIKERKFVPVYWEGKGGAVMRCSWFRRIYSEAYPVPYSESVSEKLEEEYKDAMLTGQWHRQVELPAGERVMLNSPYSMHHYQVQEQQNITTLTESQYPQTVRRGADDFEIKDGDAEQVDHLLFLIHGIGSVCDLRFRTVELCVDDFRNMSEELLATHFKESVEAGRIGRVEILPISWHKALHGDQTGLDEKLKSITLRSIPKLREFTNDTILDVFLYTSPKYCQHIIGTVASEIERLLVLFRKRNPNFKGGISLGGHSLGSVILFDLLMHQNPENSAVSSKALNEENSDSSDVNKECNESHAKESSFSLTSQVNFQLGLAGTGQPAVIYPQLSFHPEAFFLMGSPVGMFITVRGIDTLGPSFKLPTCDRVFNIFHPFDPVAYRMETLLDTSFSELRPVLIPHHKGRKRMHLELKDTIERVGSDIKNKIVESIQSTWNKFYQIYSGSDSDAMRTRVDQAVEEEMQRANPDSQFVHEETHDVKIGQLNRGLRVDYVLQEKPYESFTEYIFALQAHVSYWSSEDTMLMILKELYKINGINSDIRLQHRRLSEADTTSPSSTKALLSEHSSMNMSSQNNPQISFSNAAPIPLFTPPQVDNNVPLSKSTVPKVDGSKTLRGRPVFDPLKSQIPSGGMDPTAPPSTRNLPPPPVNTKNVSFNRKKT